MKSLKVFLKYTGPLVTKTEMLQEFELVKQNIINHLSELGFRLPPLDYEITDNRYLLSYELEKEINIKLIMNVLSKLHELFSTDKVMVETIPLEKIIITQDQLEELII